MAFYDSASYNPDVSIGYLAKRVMQSSMAGLEREFVGEDISYLQWCALVSILFGRGSTCKALAYDIAHDRGATTRLLDSLEQLRLVVRERDPDDRRVVNLALTTAGESAARRCLARVVDLWNGWLGGWDAADVARLITYLQRLRVTLEDAMATEDIQCA